MLNNSLGRLGVLLLGLAGLSPQAFAEQQSESDQLWLNYIIARPVSERLYFEYDLESAHQINDSGAGWHTAYGTGLVEFYPNKWLDLTGELVTGFTKQDDNEDSFETAVRLGVRFQFIKQFLFSPRLDQYRPERLSGQRLSFANLARIEGRSFWYSSDRDDSQDVRFRNRIELKWALNRDSLSEDGVWHIAADAEWFVPMQDEDLPERFATKRRYRLGIGYRHSYRWRWDIMLMRDHAKETLDEEFDVDANMVNFRLKMFL